METTINRPFIVWERHSLSDKELGKRDGDVPHGFWEYGTAKAFIEKVMDLHPNRERYTRIIHFGEQGRGFDFGSHSDFLVLISRDEPLPQNFYEEVE